MLSSLRILFLLLLCSSAKAQQNHFVYIQADDRQPFYIKLEDRMLSSSATGYIVVPKLTAGNYTFTLGFPKNIFPEQTLAVIVANTDAGYLLKNYGDKGWGLFNLQTNELTLGGTAPVKQSDNDVFTSTLSGAANTVLTAKPTTTPLAADSVAVTMSIIEKLNQVDAPEGSSMVFTDRTGSNTDTIRIFIPAGPVKIIETNNSVVPEPVKDTKFLDIELQNPNTKPALTTNEPKDTGLAVSVPPATAPDKPMVSFNSDCRANADDEDFMKIRKKMGADITNEDKMTDIAKKFFKAKCYSVAQVRNLSLLYFSDDGKYKFFDAAYPHVYDTQNFGSLQSELHDEYYVNRFRAMVRR